MQESLRTLSEVPAIPPVIATATTLWHKCMYRKGKSSFHAILSTFLILRLRRQAYSLVKSDAFSVMVTGSRVTAWIHLRVLAARGINLYNDALALD